MMTDPLGDMLARIRNAGQARHAEVTLPPSRLKLSVAKVLAEAGFVGEVKLEEREGREALVIEVRYGREGQAMIDGLRRVSRPGRRVYVAKDEVPRVRNGLGVAVISTSRGVLSDAAAREAAVGGEFLCEVW